jgi:hypothetical protein
MRLVHHQRSKRGGIYYIYIAPKFEFPGPEYTLTVEETLSPTPAPTMIVTSAPVTGAAGTCLGALFRVVFFATMYFSV